MAITIRDTEKHEEMIDELKKLSCKGTASGSLIEGGYMALRYHGLYQAECIKSQSLQSDLRRLERKIDTYLSALDGLRGQ